MKQEKGNEAMSIMGTKPAALKFALACILVFPPVSFSDTGSDLERFERDATRPRSTAKASFTPPPDTYYGAPSYAGSGIRQNSSDTDIGSQLIMIVPEAMALGGAYSWQRVSLSFDERDVTRRAPGEGVIPFVRVDASYNRVGSDVHAVDTRAEIGYGPFGFEVRQMRYTESGPDAALDVQQYHALYRMSAGDHIEIDIGYGRLDLAGVSHNSGSSWTLPVIIHPSTQFGIEFRPSWANINGTTVGNHELAISFGDRFWAARGGYHWLESPADRLGGPFLGLSLRL